jgi:hypothetical protein
MPGNHPKEKSNKYEVYFNVRLLSHLPKPKLEDQWIASLSGPYPWTTLVRGAMPGTPANTSGAITVYYSPMDAQVIVLKNNIKIYVKIAPTHFHAVTPSSGSSTSLLAKVTFC